MRNVILLISLIILSVILATGCSSGGAKAPGGENTGTDSEGTSETSSTDAVEDGHNDSLDATAASSSGDVEGNQVCPVSGEDIDPDVFVEYKGKRINVCCNKCLKKVKESPDEWYEKVYGDA